MAKTRAKPSLHRDSFVAPLARGTRTLPGAVVGLRLLKHTAGPLAIIDPLSRPESSKHYKVLQPNPRGDTNFILGSTSVMLIVN